MSIGKKSKDQLKKHSGVTLVESIVLPESDDPLRFWTGHPTENELVNLYPLANGELINPHRSGSTVGAWGGKFNGRPLLIKELAPAIHARLSLLGSGSARFGLTSLRVWWRLFDAFEETRLPDGRIVPRVQSVADLNELHEAFAHQNQIKIGNFRWFLNVANVTRRLMKLPALLWVPPKEVEPNRTLITEDQARELKTAIKQDWQRVRNTWVRNDEIRKETAKRAAGESPSKLGEDGEFLLKNWRHFHQIQQKSGRVLPTHEQLLDGGVSGSQYSQGLERLVMRSILFPTAEEADIAFHMALMNSGWNPSTLANLDAASSLIINHPKDKNQLVLSTDVEDEEITMQGVKPRARGKTQFCTGLLKTVSSPPVIVATYLKRVELLRKTLKQDYQEALEEFEKFKAAGFDQLEVEAQFKKVQRLRQGCRSVWLYVDARGKIKWIGYRSWNKYLKNGISFTYLMRVIERLNNRRQTIEKPLIAKVTPSDFRDIYARWVYRQSEGNILAVMLALGHSSLSSTVKYTENNIFNAENDEHALRFMSHLFEQLGQGRVDLTILAQLVRNGELTYEMETRLIEYRTLMRSRIGVGCTDPRNPPQAVAPNHIEGRMCGSHRCLKECSNAKFLPESLDGIAMRVEELMAMSDHMPLETWQRGGFEAELETGECLLKAVFPKDAVVDSREIWRKRIASGEHLIPGLGRVTEIDEVAI